MITAIPYGATWRTIEIALAASGPSGWELPGFDDSSWPELPAPFGVTSVSGCAVHSTNPPATVWTSNTSRLYRTTVAFGGQVTFRGPIDNEVAIWLDGVAILAQTAGDTRAGACAHYDDWNVSVVAASALHTVAVRTWDFGFETYFDLIAVVQGGWGVGQVRIA